MPLMLDSEIKVYYVSVPPKNALGFELEERWMPDEFGLVQECRTVEKDIAGSIVKEGDWHPTGITITRPLQRLSRWEKICGWLRKE